ncbi:cupin domain-containing protein [Spirosoma sp. HMF3257]|uniref:Cupin n=1 Tax=Spirosoma telluris TaxID=2183553 RepID=A0A327NRS1_9BACT|nr:cupin domain-containing protein [Spirosoma telluris]RAI77435.1 cupin [Spirosoma telluris]
MENQSRRSALKAMSAAAIGATLPHEQEVNLENGTQTKPFVIREAEGRFDELYHIMGFELSLKVSGKDTNEQLSTYYGTYKKNDGPPLHVHYKQDEEFYIVDGEVLFQVGNEKFTLKVGDTIYLPRNVPHTFLVLSETARLFFQTNPSGKTEAFFKKLSQLGPKATMDEVQKLHLAHDLSIVGPPLKV